MSLLELHGRECVCVCVCLGLRALNKVGPVSRGAPCLVSIPAPRLATCLLWVDVCVVLDSDMGNMAVVDIRVRVRAPVHRATRRQDEAGA